MNKEKLKNLKEIILYTLLIFLGIIIMLYPSFGLLNSIHYISSLFLIFAFFIIIVYFIAREKGNYNLLFEALISIITATFMFITSDGNPSFILGSGILIFTLLTLVNKGIDIYRYRVEYIWIIKFIITFLIAFLGFLTINNLYRELSVQTLMIGYYFVTFGIISLIEPVIYLFIPKNKISILLKEFLTEEEIEKAPIKTETKKQTKKTTTTKNKTKTTSKNKKSTTNNRTTKTNKSKTKKISKPTSAKKSAKK